MPNIKASFDAATLADAVQKASRVAPSKGSAYDKARGLLFSAGPGSEEATVRATDLDTTFLQRIRHAATPPPDGYNWRIPSNLLSGLVSQFPMNQGSVVTFIDTGDGAIRIVAGSVKVKLALIMGDGFPTIDDFPNGHMGEAHDFAQRATQVTWACDKSSKGVLSGVHIDGESLIACDSHNAAIVPCKVPISKPVTVPLWNITGLLKSASDVRVEAMEKELRLSLDAETRATSRLIEGEYPNVKELLRDDYTGSATIERSVCVDAINRMLVVAQSERLPVMKMSFETGLVKKMILDLEVVDSGDRIQDELLIKGDYDNNFSIWFTPTAITQAFDNAKSENVEFLFGHPDANKGPLSPCLVKAPTGYQAMVMPRQHS